MKNVYFIINNHGNHKTIINSGSGASEFLFYVTAYKLSEFFNVTIFNRDNDEKRIDNVQYLFLPDNSNPNIEDIKDSIVIVQRFFGTIIDLHKINPSNRYILWSHDYLQNSFTNLSNNLSAYEINKYFSENNINIVSVSNFHKKNIANLMKDIRIIPIYNALFDEYYPNLDIEYNKNHIIFASNWGKGIDKILRIGEEYYKRNKAFKLLMLKPVYCDWVPDFNKYPFIDCIGNIKNKEEYCKLLKSCLCVFSTSYTETFGCVFAEALHLGVPVICDTSVESGSHEIIQEDHCCNFNNPMEVITKIEELRKNRPSVKLNDMFYEKNVINEWFALLNE